MDEEVRITLRLPSSLRDSIVEASRTSSRSLNGEIVHRLEASFGDDGGINDVANAAFISGISIGLVESFLSEDDPVEALKAYRTRSIKRGTDAQVKDLTTISPELDKALDVLARLRTPKVQGKDKVRSK